MQNTNPAPAQEQFQRGSAIRFINGDYVGKQGWFDASKTHTRCRYYVLIVQDGRNGASTIKATWVNKPSVSVIAEERAPTTFEEAVLQTHPDVEKAMNKLVASFAQCGIRADSTVIGRILSEKLLLANVAHAMKGHKATYRVTHWPPVDDNAEDEF
jgi:hypothetical protein